MPNLKEYRLTLQYGILVFEINKRPLGEMGVEVIKIGKPLPTKFATVVAATLPCEFHSLALFFLFLVFFKNILLLTWVNDPIIIYLTGPQTCKKSFNTLC